ncbi:hypothetical protein ABH926_002392 [Catenulispora sp. GP43]|uniref:hypothetical protein n=1 Tax=Catenulispora sp. GP43 TaxID=3156263 RepID=UPI0035149D41
MGSVLRISAAAVEVRVARVDARTVYIEWPWLSPDPGSRSPWDGLMGFPRDPDHSDWRNTPWRIAPDTSELSAGDVCIIGVPATEVRVAAITHYDPPADLGWLPRPRWMLDLVPLEYGTDPEAGYGFALDTDEPVKMEIVSHTS